MYQTIWAYRDIWIDLERARRLQDKGDRLQNIREDVELLLAVVLGEQDGN